MQIFIQVTLALDTFISINLSSQLRTGRAEAFYDLWESKHCTGLVAIMYCKCHFLSTQ